VLERAGLHSAGGDATFFLWLDGGPEAEALAGRLIEGGVVVTPGSYFGAAGEGFLRMALVPPLADCERAVTLLERLL
jgi:aspartate/methionine/tyrosine aminotransferase